MNTRPWGGPVMNIRPWRAHKMSTPPWQAPAMNTQTWGGPSLSTRPWGRSLENTEPWRQPIMAQAVNMQVNLSTTNGHIFILELQQSFPEPPVPAYGSASVSPQGNIEILPVYTSQQVRYRASHIFYPLHLSSLSLSPTSHLLPSPHGP